VAAARAVIASDKLHGKEHDPYVLQLSELNVERSHSRRR